MDPVVIKQIKIWSAISTSFSQYWKSMAANAGRPRDLKPRFSLGGEVSTHLTSSASNLQASLIQEDEQLV